MRARTYRVFFTCVQVLKNVNRHNKVAWAIGSQVETHSMAVVVKSEVLPEVAMKLVAPFFAKKFPYLQVKGYKEGEPDMVK